MNAYKKRIADKILGEKLEAKGAVLIEGPKWCGKTTTALQIAESVLRMDEPAKRSENLAMVDIEPSRLLAGAVPRLIDEWQIAPKLWDAIRYEIDMRGEDGQFILTGSAVPVESKEIMHSGTGRFSLLKMRPMSLFESEDSSGDVSLESLFLNPKMIQGESRLDVETLAFLICRGGWPRAIGRKTKNALMQAFDYFDAVVRSDINQADGVQKNPERVKKLMRAYARHQGTQAANAVLKDDVAVNEEDSFDVKTVVSYVTALERIFVTEELAAWNPNLRSKTAVRTAATRFYVDPSIATAAFGLGPNDLVSDLRTMGLMFETLCIRDLRVYTDALGGDVFHFREKNGLECDAIIHLRNGSYGLAEIKLGGDRLIAEAVESLHKIKTKLDLTKMPAPSFMMVIVGIGTYAYRRKGGIHIVPIACLKH